MSDIGPGKSGAGGAVAVRIERPRIVAVLGALDVEPAVAGEDCPAPSHPRGSNAVEEIDAATNAFHQILGETDSHQVAGMGFRQGLVDDLDHLVHRVLFLADGQSADPESRPVVHRPDRLGGFATEMGVDPALNDRKQRLMVSGVVGGHFLSRGSFERLTRLEPGYFCEAPRQPADAALAGIPSGRLIGLAGDDVIELHYDVSAEVALDAHHAFGGEEAAGAIDV